MNSLIKASPLIWLLSVVNDAITTVINHSTSGSVIKLHNCILCVAHLAYFYSYEKKSSEHQKYKNSHKLRN